jgi:hypothetical protein
MLQTHDTMILKPLVQAATAFACATRAPSLNRIGCCYAFDVANFGPYADPRTLEQLAHEAEDSGWDGFFIWDHVQVSWPDSVGDPTIALD